MDNKIKNTYSSSDSESESDQESTSTYTSDDNNNTQIGQENDGGNYNVTEIDGEEIMNMPIPNFPSNTPNNSDNENDSDNYEHSNESNESNELNESNESNESNELNESNESNIMEEPNAPEIISFHLPSYPLLFSPLYEKYQSYEHSNKILLPQRVLEKITS